MNQVKDLAMTCLQNPQKERLFLSNLKSPDEIFQDKLIDRLFVRLLTNYGHKFKSQYTTANLMEAAKKEWGYALTPYDKEVFSYAIKEMRKHYKEWPPTIAQFVDLCKKYYQTLPVLEAPKVESADKNIGNAALIKIRKSLGKYPKE